MCKPEQGRFIILLEEEEKGAGAQGHALVCVQVFRM